MRASCGRCRTAAPNHFGIPITKAGITIGTVREVFTRGMIATASCPKPARPARCVCFLGRLAVTSEGRMARRFDPERYAFQRDRNTQKPRWYLRLERGGKFLHRSTAAHGTNRLSLPQALRIAPRRCTNSCFVRRNPESVTTWMTKGRRPNTTNTAAQAPVVVDRRRDYSTVHYARVAQAGESNAELWLAADILPFARENRVRG